MTDPAQTKSILEKIAALAAESPELRALMGEAERSELSVMLSSGGDLRLADLQDFLARSLGGEPDEDSQPEHL